MFMVSHLITLFIECSSFQRLIRESNVACSPRLRCEPHDLPERESSYITLRKRRRELLHVNNPRRLTSISRPRSLINCIDRPSREKGEAILRRRRSLTCNGSLGSSLLSTSFRPSTVWRNENTTSSLLLVPCLLLQHATSFTYSCSFLSWSSSSSFLFNSLPSFRIAPFTYSCSGPLPSFGWPFVSGR